MPDPANLPYRPCVGVMLVNAHGRAFVGKRIDNREGDWWQMPQGGIDEGEDLHAAGLRELWEETGIAAELVTLIAQTREEVLYDLPPDLLGRVLGGKYRGQTQKWFLLRFTGDDREIDIDPADHDKEFDAWRWAPLDDVLAEIVPFKRDVYEQVIAEFRPLVVKG